MKGTAGQKKQDGIEYGAVYDCGAGRSKFRVVSCEGEAGGSDCDVFYIDEHLPGGGSHVSTSRSVVLEAIRGCAITGLSPAGARNADNEPVSGNRNPAVEKAQELGEAAPKEQPKGCSSAAAFEYSINQKYQPIGSVGPRSAETLFYTFVMGSPVQYIGDGAVNVTAYPVHARYTVRSEYDDAFREEGWDNRFICFQDMYGECVCKEQGGSRVVGSRKIPKQK